MTREGKCDLTN